METWFGRGGLAHVAQRLGELGAHRVLVLAPPSRRFVAEVVATLHAFEPSVFDGARVHVPAEVVEAADARLRELGADTIVAIGGGSPIGLGKALRLRHDVKFVAIPTTYAGSEMTSMFGVTHDRDKTTGRDPKVRPDLVVYDVAFTQDLPIALTVQSLFNALAHVVSVVSTGLLSAPDRADALAGAATVIRAIEDLLLAPTDARAREQAQRGASRCATECQWWLHSALAEVEVWSGHRRLTGGAGSDCRQLGLVHRRQLVHREYHPEWRTTGHQLRAVLRLHRRRALRR